MNITLFDKILWRFNGFVIALLCVGALILFAFSCVGLVMNSIGRGTISSAYKNHQPNRSGDDQFRLSDFQRIQGTPFLVASLNQHGYSSGSILNSGSYGSASGSFTPHYSRNFLFFDTRNGRSRWLAPDNSSAFSSYELYADPALKQDEQKTVGLIYEIHPEVEKNRQNPESGVNSIIFYDLESASTKTVAKNIDRFLGVQQIEKDKAVILFEQGDKNYALSIKTSSGAPVEKHELASIPAE